MGSRPFFLLRHFPLDLFIMSNTNRIKLTALLFGQARECVGAPSLDLEVAEPATVESAFAILKAEHPKLAQMERSLLFAVNEEYAARSQALAEGDRLAILPPVSGGEDEGGKDESGDVVEITRE